MSKRKPGRSRQLEFVGSARLFGLCALNIVMALLLGGGARSGFLGDAIIQVLAIPLLVLSLWRLLQSQPTAQVRVAAGFCLSIVVLPLLQLVPLPAMIWTALPGRQALVTNLALISPNTPWLPLSVTPHATWLSALAILPPIALFLGTIQLTGRYRRQLTLIILLVAMASVFLGLVQVAQGTSSGLRFFDYTNNSEAVGFFANRNHLAALLYASTLFVAAWVVDTGLGFDTQAGSASRSSFDTLRMVSLVAGLTAMVLFVTAQAMARSRAGLGLSIVALFGTFALAYSGQAATSKWTPSRLMAAAIGLAFLFATQFALYRIMERFADDPLADARIPFARNTITAALQNMPFGTGLGSFVQVYGGFERPQDTLANTFANHAHNDFLELWLETGVFGIAGVACFVVWFSQRTFEIWARKRSGAVGVDALLAQAATLVAALLLVHSVVDYPLRTTALAMVFAFCCALLIPARRQTLLPAARETRVVGDGKSGSEPPAAPQSSLSRSSGNPVRGAAGRWGEELEWPDQWRRKTASPASPKPRPADFDEPSDE